MISRGKGDRMTELYRFNSIKKKNKNTFGTKVEGEKTIYLLRIISLSSQQIWLIASMSSYVVNQFELGLYQELSSFKVGAWFVGKLNLIPTEDLAIDFTHLTISRLKYLCM